MIRRARNIQFSALDNPNSTKYLIFNKTKKGFRAKNTEVYTPLVGVRFIVRSCFFDTQKIFNKEDLDNSVKDKVIVDYMRGSYSKDINYHFIAFVSTYEYFCGNGNFLEIIYRTKLKALFQDAKQHNIPYKNLKNIQFIYMLMNLISSVYAVDILRDNVILSRARCYIWINKVFKIVFGKPIPLSLARIIDYLLRCMIIHNDTFANEFIHLHLYCDIDGMCHYFFTHHNHYLEKRYDSSCEWQDNDNKNIQYFKKHITQMKDIYNHYVEVSNTIDSTYSKAIIAKIQEESLL